MDAISVLVVEPISKYSLERVAAACIKNNWQSHLLITESNKLTADKDKFSKMTTFDSLNMSVDDVLACLEENEFSTVIPASEFAVPLAEKIADAKGLYHNPLSMVKFYRDKSEMRKKFGEIGVSQPKVYAEIADMSRMNDVDWNNFNYPVVAKPVEAAGSVLVKICANQAEAKQAVEDILLFSESRVTNLTFKTKALVEEAVLGPEYSNEVLVCDGKVLHSSITKKVLSPEPFCHEVGHIVGADVPQNIHRQVENNVSQLVKGWQIDNGILHVEYKAKKDKIYIIEAAARIAGDLISELVNLQYDINLEESFIIARSGRQVAVPKTSNGKDIIHGIRFIFDQYDLNEIKGSEFTSIVKLDYDELDSKISTDYSFTERKGYAIISCKKQDYERLLDLIRMAHKEKISENIA
jgi:biotin carboxylase